MEYKKSALKELQEQLDSINQICERGVFSNEFTVWRTKSLAIIESLFGTDSTQTQQFKNISYSPAQRNARNPELVKRKAFESGLEQAKALILTWITNINVDAASCTSDYPKQRAIQFIKDLCKRFPQVAKRICTEYRGKKLLEIVDEYDVQHLFHALLAIQFDDIRAEDVNSSYAGATSRVDFLLKQEKIVIEIKKTRKNLKDKEIGEQLIIDMKRYSQSQDCETLFCFVYDPEQLISNPYGLEKDINGRHDDLDVIIVIAPKPYR